MRILGIPDEPAFLGSQREIFQHYGLTQQGVRGAAIHLLERKRT
jgi:transketolase